jgi:hypothetical protein
MCDEPTSSLWITENGDDDEPDYIRVLCGAGDPDAEPGNFKGFFGDLGDSDHGLVEFSQDTEAIYLFGEDDSCDQSTWKSDDDAQTFGSHRDVKSSGGNWAYIHDWVITDEDTIYAAVDDDDNDGFFMTTNSGLSWSSTDAGGDMNDIALSPDFEDGEGYILLGGMSGEVALSDDDGDSFDDAEDEEQSGLDNAAVIFVAFDADFADEDADGYMYIYAADDDGSDIQEGEVADTDDVDWDELEDDKGDGDPQSIYCAGLQVAEDNALYAIGSIEEVEAEEIQAEGTINIEGDTSAETDTVDVDEEEITETDGTFDDGENLIVTGANLEADSSTVVSGRVYVEGDTSDAEGYFDITITGLSGYDSGEDVDITDSDLDVDIEGGAGAGDIGVARLLLWESNNVWEYQSDDDLEEPMDLWVSYGSNVLWTIDNEGGDGELWDLEDTCSGQVMLDAPPDGYKADREDQMRISWEEVRDADWYEYKYTNVDPDYTLSDEIEDETSVLLTRLDGTSEYSWKVRVAVDEPWSSRWSDSQTFFTALGEPPWAPTLYTPGGIWQYSGIDVELMPAFSWESANTADSYQFVLADNSEFTSPLVDTKVSTSAYQLDFELEYNSNYFWRVMAYKGAEALSRWSDVGAFTTIEKAPPAPPPPPTSPTPTLTVQPVVTPTPIPLWAMIAIIAIGGVLVITVIVLIWRTRRPM